MTNLEQYLRTTFDRPGEETNSERGMNIYRDWLKACADENHTLATHERLAAGHPLLRSDVQECFARIGSNLQRHAGAGPQCTPFRRQLLAKAREFAISDRNLDYEEVANALNDLTRSPRPPTSSLLEGTPRTRLVRLYSPMEARELVEAIEARDQLLSSSVTEQKSLFRDPKLDGFDRFSPRPLLYRESQQISTKILRISQPELTAAMLRILVAHQYSPHTALGTPENRENGQAREGGRPRHPATPESEFDIFEDGPDAEAGAHAYERQKLDELIALNRRNLRSATESVDENAGHGASDAQIPGRMAGDRDPLRRLHLFGIQGAQRATHPTLQRARDRSPAEIRRHNTRQTRRPLTDEITEAAGLPHRRRLNEQQANLPEPRGGAAGPAPSEPIGTEQLGAHDGRALRGLDTRMDDVPRGGVGR